MSNTNAAPSVVAILGPDGVGKSTLAQALMEAASRFDVQTGPRAVQVQGRSATVIDLRLPRRFCQLVDFRDADTEAAILGASPIHGALLVISATDSIVAGHQASLTRARQFGIPIIAVALTKCDAVEDVELLDLVTMEIRELLNKYGMPGDSFPIVQTRHFGTRPAEGRRHDREPEARQGIPALLDMLGG